MSREVPAGWQAAQIGDIADIRTGGTPSRSNPLYWGGDIDWMASGEIHQRYVTQTAEKITGLALQESNAQILPVGSVMVALNGQGKTRGKAAILRKEMACNQSLAAIIPRKLHIPEYFLFLFEAMYADLRNLTGDDARNGLNLGILRSLSVVLPPPDEQRRIAEILSTVDDAIAATRAVIEQTKKVKQGALERLLTKGIGHMRFKHTEIGEVPAAWEVGRIDDFFVLQRGFDITEKQAVSGEHPVISSSGFSYFHSQAMVPAPAVVTGRKGKLGQVYFIEKPCWPHDTTLWVKDFKENEPKYVHWFLRSLNLEKFDAATAVPTLNRNVVHAQKCAFPPREEQVQIAEYLDGLEHAEKAQEQNLRCYNGLKSALMSDLITGRKRVTNTFPLAAE